MPTKVLMPSLGESVVEGTITRWLKAPGDQVEEYEPLLEVNTDKVDSEIPSPAAGTLLEILVPEGTTIQAGSLLAWIGEAGEAPPSTTMAPAMQAKPGNGHPQVERETPEQAAPIPVAQAAAGKDRELGFISPVVARIASENNIDLYQVPGTGQGGRITKRDVLAFLEQRTAAPQEAVAEAPAPAKPLAPRAAQPLAGPPAAGEILPLTPVRRAIAEHMVMSKHTSPHVTTVMQVDLSRVVAHRKANKDRFAQDGVNLTFTAYFIAAIVAALKAFPIANSSWSDEGIVLHRDINIGMATSLGEAGLIVPVIKNADSLSLLGLARTINDLAERARTKQLRPDEVKGGTFTLTNHGVSGSLFATPVINQPQCAILGVGMLEKRVVVVEGPDGGDTIAIRPMAYVSLTFDHRILDGAIADHVLGKVVEYLQNWG